jgi:hypothetical protein
MLSVKKFEELSINDNFVFYHGDPDVEKKLNEGGVKNKIDDSRYITIGQSGATAIARGSFLVMNDLW